MDIMCVPAKAAEEETKNTALPFELLNVLNALPKVLHDAVMVNVWLLSGAVKDTGINKESDAEHNSSVSTLQE
jgi:hypothetical protein